LVLKTILGAKQECMQQQQLEPKYKARLQLTIPSSISRLRGTILCRERKSFLSNSKQPTVPGTLEKNQESGSMQRTKNPLEKALSAVFT